MEDYDFTTLLPFENYSNYEDIFTEMTNVPVPRDEVIIDIVTTVLTLIPYAIAIHHSYKNLDKDLNSKLLLGYFVLSWISMILKVTIHMLGFFGRVNDLILNVISIYILFYEINSGFTLALGLDALLITYPRFKLLHRWIVFVSLLSTRLLTWLVPYEISHDYHSIIIQVDSFVILTLNIIIFINLFVRIYSIYKTMDNIGLQKAILVFLLLQLSHHFFLIYLEAYSKFLGHFYTSNYSVTVLNFIRPTVYIFLVRNQSPYCHKVFFYWMGNEEIRESSSSFSIHP
uniref:Uncharacterized protein n=1 Tax=Lepeophtheirus salmonis TaxID=72036 RepID=A0A0K2TD91_LEPSM